MRSFQQAIAARPLPRDKRSGKVAFARAVGALVPKLTAAAFERYGFHSAEIMTSWPTIVGDDLARLTSPQSIKWPRGKASSDDPAGASEGATLNIACDPAFALDISYRTDEIADRINRYFGYKAISRIKIHQVPVDRGEAEKAGRVPPPRIVPQAVAAPSGTDDLDSALASLGRSIASAAET